MRAEIFIPFNMPIGTPPGERPGGQPQERPYPGRSRPGGPSRTRPERRGPEPQSDPCDNPGGPNRR